MLLKDFYKLTNGCYNSTNSILHILRSDDSQNMPQDRQHILKLIKNDTTEFEINNDVFGLMTTVNKMVKHESCPHNIRNRFYSLKHRFIKLMVEHRMADKVVYESEKLHKFTFGPYEFHQYKFQTIPSGYTIEKEDYVNNHESIEFSMNTYKEASIAMIYRMHQIRKSR